MQQREQIPDNADLFRRIVPEHYDKSHGKFVAVAFIVRPRDRGKLSVNWCKYATPKETSVDPNPRYGGRRLFVGELKARIPRQQELEVLHAPNEGNPAHSVIKGRKLVDPHSRLEVAAILADSCRPLITSIEQFNC